MSKEEIVKNEKNLVLPSVESLVKAGAYKGHQKKRIHPSNKDNICGVQVNNHVINLKKTIVGLEEVIKKLKSIFANRGQVLFVATKPSVKDLVKNLAQNLNMPYVNQRWLGGIFTNSEEIKKSVDKLKRIERLFETREIEKYPRYEQLSFKKQKEKLNEKFGGIKNMGSSFPEAIFVQDVKNDFNAVKEAKQVGIPVIALLDTNIDARYVDYPIPCSDDSIETLKIIIKAIEDNIK